MWCSVVCSVDCEERGAEHRWWGKWALASSATLLLLFLQQPHPSSSEQLLVFIARAAFYVPLLLPGAATCRVIKMLSKGAVQTLNALRFLKIKTEYLVSTHRQIQTAKCHNSGVLHFTFAHMHTYAFCSHIHAGAYILLSKRPPPADGSIQGIIWAVCWSGALCQRVD